jgi:uncharacterized iron-regulated membrane protein
VKKLNWAKHQKRWFGKWHLYLGIFAGAIIAFIGLTGSILTFRDEIDESLNRQLFEVPAQHQRLSPTALIALVHKKYPTLNYNYITIPKRSKPGATYVLFERKKEEQNFINPYNADIVGSRLYDDSFIGIVTELHTSLFIPGVGRYIVGLCALILLILTISGLRLWIPKKVKHLRGMLSVNFKGNFKRKNYDWHNVIGFYTSPIVMILSLTGFMISFSILFIPLIFILNGQSAKGVASLLNAQSIEQKNVVPIGFPQVIKIASEAMPGADVRGITPPLNKKGSYRLDLVKDGFPSTGRRLMLSLDQYSGKVLLNSNKDFPEVGKAYLSWLGPIHYGSFGGLTTKIIALIAGLVPLALFITGFITWWPRWKKQLRRRHEHKELEKEVEKVKVPEPIVGTGAYLIHHLKKGFIYGLWMLVIGLCAGTLYGLAVGIIIQPALFVVLFATLLVTVNFFISFILMLLNTILLMPLKKSFRNITRYFSWSFSIFVVFIFTYTLINYSGIHVF